MSKLAWVALPLLLAAAWVAWLALRGRLPPRLSLNVWFSLLLLAYVLTTAGLGIFWVANQHLPVFDWHYLFGYATVLLLVLHLAFNFRVVWRHLKRRRADAASTTASAPTDTGRRGAFGLAAAMGVTLSAGAGYLLGLRHGRTELRIDAAATPASEAAGLASGDRPGRTALAVVEQFHEFSAHSRAGVFRRAPGVDWGDRPPPFKAYAGATRVALPAPDASVAARTPVVLDLATLGALLWHTAGISEQRGTIAFRTSPSSGALFATELYVAARSVLGLAGGLWHYDAQGHALQRLADGVPDTQALGADRDAADAPVLVLATAIFRRSGHKYRDRAYRYVVADLGHALENLRAAADALGLRCTFARRFDESRAAGVLGVDEAEEGVLALASLAPASAPAAAAAGGVAWHSAALAAAAPLGVTDAVHRATSLRVAAGGSGNAGAPLPPIGLSIEPPTQRSGPPTALPSPRQVPVAVLKEIARRRSVRRFADTPLALADLSAVLEAMARGAPPQFSNAVRVDVITHAVRDLPSRSWRYEAAAHALVPRRAAAVERAASRRAALDQDVIGDAAVVFVLSIDRAVFTSDPAGAARGYRHAFLEAGLIGERIYLHAGALGLGVCAVGAFYDDEASALVGVDPRQQWVVHFAALGVPA